MPSTYTASLRFELQGVGENLNTWGTRLNTALSRIDKAVAGRTTIVLTGAAYTLSTSNTADDEARSMILDLSGVGGCNLVIPSVPKAYWVRNASNGAVTVTTGAGATVVLGVGDAANVFCDGAGVCALQINGQPIKAYVDAVRAYVDAQAWGSQAGALPGQAGNDGKFLRTDGVTPSWVQPQTSDISDLAAYSAARLAAATVQAQMVLAPLAVAMAVAL